MTTGTLTVRPRYQSIPLVLAGGCLVAILSFGPRSTMGFFLTPMTTQYGWSRETFALAIAIQNLVWGIGQPFVGILADKFGTARVLIGGGLLYALGLALMAYTTDPIVLQLTGGVLIGLGIAGSAFVLVTSAFARLLPDDMRAVGFGVGTAAGSVGQFIFAPLGQGFISAYGWQTALLLMASFMLAIPFLAAVVRGKPQGARVGHRDQSVPERSAKPSATGPTGCWSRASSSAASSSRSSPFICRPTSPTSAFRRYTAATPSD